MNFITVVCVLQCVVATISDVLSAVTLTAMKGVTSLPTRPSSCTVLKPPPPYSCCLAPSVSGFGVETAAALSGYTRTSSGGGGGGIDEDDVKSRRRSRVCSRSPGSAPPTMAAKTRRYKRPSSGVDQARRQQQQLQQSYVNMAHRQMSSTDCHTWPGVDSAYQPGTDYATAACHSVAEVASCRYQATASVRPPYRHDLLAVVPAIGPGETGPAAERLKQMAANYQRLAAASDGESGAPSSTSSFGCYDDRYSYELYDEFAAQCQRFAVQPNYQQQSLYYDASGYSPMVTDAHGYLTATCNGVSQPPSNSTHSRFALPEPEAISAISASHVAPQFNYNGGLAGNAGYSMVDEASRYMSPCVQQTATSTAAAKSLQVPASLYSSGVTSVTSCQPTLMSTARQTPMCFATESARQPVDSFLEVYPPPASVTISTSSSTSNTSPNLSSRRVSTSSSSSAVQLASVALPVSGCSSWTIAGDSGDVGASTTWLSRQSDGVSASPDVEAATFCDSASRGLDSGRAKPAVDAELFSRQSTLGGIELY